MTAPRSLALSLALLAPHAAAQCPVAKFRASDAAPGDELGNPVALSGDVLAAGAWLVDTSAADSGAVYVFRRGPGGWAEEAKILGPEVQNANFGIALDADGELLLVGARRDEPGGRGVAYVYGRRAGAWSEEARWLAPSGQTSDQFGLAVALAGSTAVVGAAREETAGARHGAAYVFQRSPTGWSLAARLVASDAEDLDLFGAAVAIDGDRVLVGAHRADAPDPSSGAVYVFDRSGAVWTETAILTPGAPAAQDQFGFDVSVDGDRALVGANFDDTVAGNAGAAYLFERAGGSWSQVQKLTDPSGSIGDEFGRSVAIEGDRALVGEPYDTVAELRSGSAYVFARGATEWTQTSKLSDPAGARNDNFAWTVDLDGGLAAAGVPVDDDLGTETGSAFLFTASALVGTSYCTALPSSTGSPARLCAGGSASVAANDLYLAASPVPDQPGIFFYGRSPIEIPFGDGRLCAGGGIFRLGRPSSRRAESSRGRSTTARRPPTRVPERSPPARRGTSRPGSAIPPRARRASTRPTG